MTESGMPPGGEPPDSETPREADRSRGETAVELAALADRLRAAGSVFAEEEAELLLGEAASGEELQRMTARRIAGEPLEQIVGWVEFAGLRILLERGVFVPRRRTELLARLAITVAVPGDVVVELCCGAGAIAASTGHAVPGIRLFASDVDAVAVRAARRNLGPDARVSVGDLFAALPSTIRGRIAVLAANAPYVPSAEIAFMPPEARDHEPRFALDGGPDGLDLHRRIIAASPQWLAPGGRLFIEASRLQAPVTARLMREAGLDASVHADDELDAVAVEGRRPSGPPA